MIRVDVTAQQPLNLGTRPDVGWLTDTHRFVPGSVLRGALAAIWLAANRGVNPDTNTDAEFQRIFEGSVRFGPLYPDEDALRPLSVFGCKYPGDEGCKALVHDAAFNGPAPAVCPVCYGPVVASKGSVHGAEVVGRTQVELDALGRAVDGQLFTRRALSRHTRLTGLIDGGLDGDLGWLADGELLVRLGGRRSTSGLATLVCGPEPQPESFSGWLADRRSLVVRLLSPGIFVDALGQPSWLPDMAEVGRMLGVDAVVEAAFARPAVVGGWHAVSNLPKPREFAVAAGSVFVLRFDGAQPDYEALLRLWHNGLGLRRAEGNGWLSLQRWAPPEIQATQPVSAPTEVDELFRALLGVADLVADDLRASAQDRIVHSSRIASAEVVLAKPRYRDLAPAVKVAFERGLGLGPNETAELAQRLGQWIRTRTSKKGRSAT